MWIKPLRELDIIPETRRTDFIEQVFWNIQEIVVVNSRLRDALNKRQKSYAVVEQIGDILLDNAPNFEPFVRYGAHQLYGKYEFEKEKGSNPAFAQFVEVTYFCLPYASVTDMSSLYLIGSRAKTGITQARAQCVSDQAHHPFGQVSPSS